MYGSFNYAMKITNVKNFFFEEASFIRRDFESMITMQNKANFAQKRIDFFLEKCPAIEQGNGCKIVFDGPENFKRGMNLFSLYAVFSDSFIVFCPIGDITYTFHSNMFFVNDKKIQQLENKNFKVGFDKIIPHSLLCAWMFSNAIDVAIIETNNDFKGFLSRFQNIKNTVFFKNNVDAVNLIENSKFQL